ncbi:uncharacterized protein DSM5745_05041 [Aspergillus mulundensis]|uniref:Uncharacterized protein n=1 Tax=Aspergillus mulundensis TaxID=1810919 RepID=A0A3D8S648_9EURO|nr:hypothetical protein DSM5745_05041 [Aspergillus mulundensis]RDW81484.1 hypothetical protein DSM5745_05041 [Aspergillus mulundensis]
MAGPYERFYQQDGKRNDSLTPVETKNHIRIPSSVSTAIDIDSPSIKATSIASSLTLLEQESIMAPPAYGKVYPSYHYEDLAPRPLRPTKSVEPTRPHVQPPSYTQLVNKQPVNKPLPELPPLSRKPRVPKVTTPMPKQTSDLSPVSPLSEKDLPTPGLERPHHLLPMSRGPAHLSNSSAVCVFRLDVKGSSGQLRGPAEDSKNKAATSLMLDTTTAASVSTWRSPIPQVERSHNPRPEQDQVGLLARTFQRFIPSKIFRRKGSKADQPCAAIPTLSPPMLSTRPVPHPDRQPRPAGTAPPTPVNRMKRVLSVLMDERMSLYLNNLVASAQTNSLAKGAQVQLVDGPSHISPWVQTHEHNGISSGGHCHSRQPVRSLHELDGVPLCPGSVNPTSHSRISIFHRIMQEVDDLPDLFSLALVNKASYLAFKSDELGLMKNTLKKNSPPAWELRQIKEIQCDAGNPESRALAANLYLRHYTWDLMQLARIKFLLHDFCEPLLSRDIVIDLRDPYDTRAGRVDAAIWRVWTFCHLFGNRKDRESDLQGQSRWLRGQRTGSVALPQVCRTSPDPSDFNTVLFSPPDGFAQGNPSTGLSRQELLDMVDIWIAMGALLDFLRKQTNLARQNGVFDAAETKPKSSREEVHMLRAWLDFILTLGPAAVLELAPAGPTSDPTQAFRRAKANGWTQWSPPSLKAPCRFRGVPANGDLTVI